MASTLMEQSPYGSRRRSEELDFNLREWSLRPQLSTDHNTKSRRFSGSHIRSFREDNATSFRSCITISSTASSPGYPFKEEIDPSTYSFTTALKALQARAGNNYKWECSSPDGLALNSKWNEAEKYICNPLSGQVPMECLSSKTLSGRSFRNSTNTARITMSAPLVYSRPVFTAKPTPQPDIIHFPIQEKRMESTMMMTRDIGTQSTPPEESSGSPSPAIERSNFKRCELAEDGNFPNSNANFKPLEKEVEEKETKGGKDEEEKERKKKEKEEMWRCRRSMQGQGGCLSWIRKRHSTHPNPNHNHNHNHNHKPKSSHNYFFLPYLQGC